jgi:hypothetical protein
MNTKLTVRKTGDANYIPVKYGVVEITVGANAAATYLLLETIGVGWDTESNYLAWKSTKSYDSGSGTTTLVGRNVTGIQGTLGALEAVALSAVVSYSARTPSVDRA